MIISSAAKNWLDYHRAHSKENTIRAYEFTITNSSFAPLNKGLRPTIIFSFYFFLIVKGSYL